MDVEPTMVVGRCDWRLNGEELVSGRVEVTVDVEATIVGRCGWRLNGEELVSMACGLTRLDLT